MTSIIIAISLFCQNGNRATFRCQNELITCVTRKQTSLPKQFHEQALTDCLLEYIDKK